MQAPLDDLTRLIRRHILRATTQAGSGHPTSSLSAVELMTALLFDGHFRFDPKRPTHPNNDRLIFSKGHASPLFYALWLAAGQIDPATMLTYRDFESTLEGHPTPRFPFTEAATGSLGQGLSIGLGMALNAKYLDRLPYRTYVLLGDSEMAEGSQWEAVQLAAHYELDNLVGILDVNRLGQRGETMYGHDTRAYARRLEAFGWNTIEIDGHSIDEISEAYGSAAKSNRPFMLIARTIKGKGVSFLEDAEGWHGKALNKEDLERALGETGDVDESWRGSLAPPEDRSAQKPPKGQAGAIYYADTEATPTRNAYGNALRRIAPARPEVIALDGEVSNSTRSKFFREAHPNRFFEMFIAEQNMAGAALGLALRGKTPFVSTFAAFLTRAFDQIRMSQYSDANIKFVGSHAGASIGQDGPSQMGLEDLAMFRTVQDSVVLYPCDAVSTEHLVEACADHRGITYLRTTRGETPILYEPNEDFPIGGCKVLRQSVGDVVTVVAAGITVFEALAAHELLKAQDIAVCVIDLYSIKPIDVVTLEQAAADTGNLLTVEDHRPEGGMGEAVRTALSDGKAKIRSLAVGLKPRSGQPLELLDYEEISRDAIVRHVETLMGETG